MKINLDKHLKTAESEVRYAVSEIEKLQKDCETKWPVLLKVLNQAIEWYETENLNCYTFFKLAVGRTNREDPAAFYSGLHSFLVNTCLDDSYYAVKWYKYNDRSGDFEDGGTPFEDNPCVIWTGDEDPNRRYAPEEMWQAMEFLTAKEKQREADWAEHEKWEDEWKKQKSI